MAVLLRDATVDDLSAINAITNALIDTTTYEWRETKHSPEETAQWFAAKQAGGWPVLVAVDDSGDGTVVGWAGYDDFRDSTKRPGYRVVVEHSIHVLEPWWGRGVGRALLEALLDRAAAEGRWVMVAAIDGSNEGSIAFHTRFGFVETARMPGVGVKWGRPLDLILMQREVRR